MSSDVDQFIEQLLTERTYHGFTTPNNSPLEKCFDFVLAALSENMGFNNQAVVVPYDGCMVIEVSKEMQTFVIVLYEGIKTSAMLVEKHFPSQESLVDLLNQSMLTLWMPIELDESLLCGILIAFTDGSLVATARYTNDCVRVAVTIRNIFVERVLLRVERDNHLESGLPLLEEAMRKQLSTIHLVPPPVKRLKVEHHLTATKEKFKLVSAADSILFVKFLADIAKIRESL